MSTELTAPGSSSILIKKIRPSDLILTVLIDLAAIFSILLLIAIMGYVFFRGLPQISLSFLTSVPAPSREPLVSPEISSIRFTSLSLPC